MVRFRSSIATVGFQAREDKLRIVHLLVLAQCNLGGHCEITARLIAGEGTLVEVPLLVLPKCTKGGRRERATGIRARKRLHARVAIRHVLLESVALRCRVTTVCLGANKWSFACVASQMPRELTWFRTKKKATRLL